MWAWCPKGCSTCWLGSPTRVTRGVRYRLASLLAIGVCAMTAARHNSLASMAEWVRRGSPETMRRLDLPFHPLTGRYRCPDERTLRDAFAQVDASALTRAGFARLAALTAPASRPHTPDGISEREQRRRHRLCIDPDRSAAPRRAAFAVDGKCLRGARRADGSQVFVLSAVRHSDAVTAALREIGAKTNEIPEFVPLLEQIDDTDLTDCVITVDALHAQRGHATHLVEERHAHYLLSVKNNQPTLAAQLRRLPWRQVPVLHRSTERGHGREEVREVKAATVDGLLFPHARQVVQIRRKRRRIGTKKWSTETVYAVTDLPAEQASAHELAAWAQGHRIIENAVHWSKNGTFGEDASQVRRHNTPVVMTAIRDIARGTLRLAGWANTASGRRAHTDPESALNLHGIP